MNDDPETWLDPETTLDPETMLDPDTTLDPVDLELMRRSWHRREPGRDATRRRWGALVIVVVLFLLLMVLGILLAAHAKSTGGAGLVVHTTHRTSGVVAVLTVSI